MHDQLRHLCRDNERYFEHDASAAGIQLNSSFKQIDEFLNKTQDVVKIIETFAGDYDFDENTPANGYRSFVSNFDSLVKYAGEKLMQLTINRESFFFRKSVHVKEIDVCRQMFESFLQIGECLIEFQKETINNSLSGEIFTNEDNIWSQAFININGECFKGRSIGFALHRSVRPFIQGMAVMLAANAEFYYSDKKFLTKLFYVAKMSLKYLFDYEFRAKKVTELYLNLDLAFFKSYLAWEKVYLFRKGLSIIGHRVEVNKCFEILPEPLQVFSSKFQSLVDVAIPSSHIGIKPIQCRLISDRKRSAMIGVNHKPRDEVHQPSKHLIFHVHGGAWISQSSKMHEVYLREWSSKLKVPIVSVDYSLLPEAKFPRAIEEIFYAYCWVLSNPKLVGSTGENILFFGDSAGANMLAACLIKCIEVGIRLPKGFLSAYGGYIINLVVTPSRFVSIIDPLLSYSFILQIFLAYAATSQNEDKEDFLSVSTDYMISPIWAPEDILKQFPPTKMIGILTDPCLDDTIEFAKKLKRLNVDVCLDIVDKLCHGFLLFGAISKEHHEASLLCMHRAAKLLELDVCETD